MQSYRYKHVCGLTYPDSDLLRIFSLLLEMISRGKSPNYKACLEHQVAPGEAVCCGNVFFSVLYVCIYGTD